MPPSLVLSTPPCFETRGRPARRPDAPRRVAPSGFALAAALLLGGCASVYEVKVEALARPQTLAADAVSYRIVDRSLDVPGGALRRNEIANHVRTALSAQGLFEAADADVADLVVEIDYGIGPARVRQQPYQEIVYGRPIPAGTRPGPAPEGVARELMGYTVLANTTVVREKHMSICARQNRPADEAQTAAEVWRVHATIENSSNDLRGHLPVLASAAMDHLGRNTDGTTSLELRSDSDAIRFIRKGL